jgi:hypothetical protein
LGETQREVTINTSFIYKLSKLLVYLTDML